MLINKILLWKLFFTETNSRHTVQILKSFIFMHYGMQQILLNFVFMHNTAVQKFQFFVFMGIVQLHAKMTCIHAQYHEKFWLKFRIHAKFRAKKYLFRMNAQFRAKLVSYWYENDAGFRAKKVISCKTTKLLRKRIDCFVETLLQTRNNINWLKNFFTRVV